MSDLAWAVKNGDLDQVKEMVEKKVNQKTSGTDELILFYRGWMLMLKWMEGFLSTMLETMDSWRW